ncbi:PREDICTED: tubulointerstitial nephritis antigen-like [Calidris pugnax]|uniref:tubulointerstitial nephritis antigen-like n=1 Tax=Calidris pugnax TaxID=198806 RepID=UPI00071CF8A2|nr:PREDICTED: tubulointerstitial nephritis antigen-like [Calidris pugnax]
MPRVPPVPVPSTLGWGDTWSPRSSVPPIPGDRAVSPAPLPLPAAILEVHEDFFMYKSGIYRHTPVAEGKGPKHQRHGTHSVKITGWGEEQLPDGQTQKYWTAANSWGTAWGEGGHFRIARGVNECEVETFVVGVWGRVSV